MAEVAEFPFTIDGFEDEEPETVGSFSYWPYDFDQIYSSDSEPDRDPLDHLKVEDEEERICIGSFGSDDDGLCDFFRQENNEVHNLRSSSNSNAITVTDIYDDEDPFFRVVHENNETSSNYLDLGLALGRIEEEQDENGGFMDDDEGGDFFVGRRVGESGESSEAVEEGLRMVGIESDSDEEVDDGIIGVDFRSCDEDGFGEVHDDLGIPLCWDSLQLEDTGEVNEFCEWEEVGERDDGDLLGMIVDDDDERLPIDNYDVVEGREETTRNLESSSLHRNGQYDWQVLLQANNLEENVDSEHDFDLDNDDFIYPAEYDTLFGQFLDTDSTIRGSPPAAKSVVENLPSIVLSQDDIKNKGGLCAVCKDEISTEEQAKQLPCSHFYHGECILPWLNIRNTCPVCRFELPTDDQEYEQRRNQRAGSGRSQVRLGFQLFNED
ncbi:hypothetical protein ACHQM5_008805 [Ranunculus cassubicifolius]